MFFVQCLGLAVLLFEVLLFEVLSISFTKEWDTLSVCFCCKRDFLKFEATTMPTVSKKAEFPVVFVYTNKHVFYIHIRIYTQNIIQISKLCRFLSNLRLKIFLSLPIHRYGITAVYLCFCKVQCLGSVGWKVPLVPCKG